MSMESTNLLTSILVSHGRQVRTRVGRLTVLLFQGISSVGTDFFLIYYSFWRVTVTVSHPYTTCVSPAAGTSEDVFESVESFSSYDYRQFVRWGRTVNWRLSSTWRHHWRKQFFLNGGSPFFDNFFFNTKNDVVHVCVSSALTSSSTLSDPRSSVLWSVSVIVVWLSQATTFLLLSIMVFPSMRMVTNETLVITEHNSVQESWRTNIQVGYYRHWWAKLPTLTRWSDNTHPGSSRSRFEPGHSVDVSGDQQTPSHEHSVVSDSISSVRVLSRISVTDFCEVRLGDNFEQDT